MRFTMLHKITLSIASGIGLFVINSLFLYAVFLDSELLTRSLENLVTISFILEAFVLLPVFCLLIHAAKLRSPNWKVFLLLSLGGSLAFSIPFSILLWSRNSHFFIVSNNPGKNVKFGINL